jgi:hypothetical protein
MITGSGTANTLNGEANLTFDGTTLGLTGNQTISGTLGVTGAITGTLSTAAQPNITSVGTLTGFTSTGIDDNATSTAITIDSAETVILNKSVYADQTSENFFRLKFQDTGGIANDVGIGQPASGQMGFNITAGGNYIFYNGSAGEMVRFDGSGNVGIGVVPEAWSTTFDAIQFGDQGSIFGQNSGTQSVFAHNIYHDGAYKYITTSQASRYVQSGGSHVWSVAPSGSADATISLSDAMTITNAGNVGIGTSSPNTTLTTNSGSEAVGISAQSTTTGSFIGFKDATSTNWYYNHIGAVGNNLKFTTAGAERMRIDSSGKICVNGTTTGGDMVKINNLGSSGQWCLNLNNASASNSILISAQSGTGTVIHHQMNNSNGLVGKISTNGSTTTYATSSDYRIKENVSYNFDATTRLKQLKPARFNFIPDETNTLVDGFIAHEVSSIVPEAVVGEKDAVNGDGSIMPQSIDQSKLVPLLVKTIQELEARITTLEGE